MIHYSFPSGVEVLVYDKQQRVETVFPNGDLIAATPNTRAKDYALAEELGYGKDTWAMSKDHELAHTWLAHLEGELSHALSVMAHNGYIPDAVLNVVNTEEARVLEFQRQLDKTGTRPWDEQDSGIERR